MREIKFRVWNGKKIGNALTISIQDGFIIGAQADFGDNEAEASFGQDVRYMQFTGLHDKNGKEIYEGDLMRIPAKDHWDEKNYELREVFWHDNDCADRHVGWQMNRIHYKGSLCGGYDCHSFLPKHTALYEVIGNIFENADLLT